MNHPAAFAVFGGAAVDHAAATVAPPVLHASNPGVSRATPGGVGFNVARVLARLGRRSRIVTRGGADADGDMLRATAARDGVDTAWVEVVAGGRTATYRAAFDDAGDLIIGIADMALFDAITPAAVGPAAAAATPGEAFVLDANLPAETLAAVAAAAARDGRMLAAIGVSPAKALRLLPVAGRIGWLFATRREAAAMLGREMGVPARDLAAGLVGLGVGHVIVTDSGDPLAAATAGEAHLFPTFPARVRSVNGAGDALAAGVLHGIAGGRGFFDAVLAGLAAAAITVEDAATVAPGLDAAALEARIAGARVVA